jgi:MerR family transcriptional regulator/heat shock protein HspR
VAGTEPDSARGVYGISVAAELSGTGVQNLRAYEARGLLEPARTEGGTRRYSADDLDRLRRIGELLGAGLNLAGIAMVMDLQDENTQLRAGREEPRQTTPATNPASRSRKRKPSSRPARSTGR